MMILGNISICEFMAIIHITIAEDQKKAVLGVPNGNLLMAEPGVFITVKYLKNIFNN